MQAMWTSPDDEVTQVIPRETMLEARERSMPASVEWGPGHAPIGPDRPTRDMRPLDRPGELERPSDFDADTQVDDLSDGVPQVLEGEHDTHPAIAA